jgi:UDP-N-acetylmuramyl pentapeptide phosphotransferase/UDP-N-acetylglucosamine-1-phosphate transferase
LIAVALAANGALPWQALFALVAVPVLVNVWNFMDGIDGLAASQAALVALAVALLSGMASAGAVLALVLVAACAGFLPMNFPRARIFLGDVGSGSLGYLLAALLVASAQAVSDWPGWLLLLLPPAAFLIDAGFTLSGRILRGERWWEPHVQHSYQIWARRAGRHWPVTLAYALFSLLAVILMLAALRWAEGAIIGSVLLCYVFAVLAWARLRRDVSLSKDAGR